MSQKKVAKILQKSKRDFNYGARTRMSLIRQDVPRRQGPLDNEPFINAQSTTSVNMKQDIGNFNKLEQLLQR